MLNSKEYKNPPVEVTEVIVSGNREISPGVHLISWKRTHDFHPGQSVKITVDQDIPPRIYSICSGMNESQISILFNIKEDGILTPKLAGVIPGMKIWATKSYGYFTDWNNPAWWIATGTGIAPFYSMIRSGLSGNKTLIHGVRRLDQFYFEDELEVVLGDRYIRCCSREQSCNVYPGRVTMYLEELKDLPTNINYYLCGKALMVVEVRDLLISRGIPYQNILAEIYF